MRDSIGSTNQERLLHGLRKDVKLSADKELYDYAA